MTTIARIAVALGVGALSLGIGHSASAQTAFAWACAPSSVSYDAIVSCGPYVYNSRGGGVGIKRASAGNYVVTFVGMGGRTGPGGTVQVTAYQSSAAVVCNVASWDSGGPDFVANVHCLNTRTGGSQDSTFNVLVGWFGQ